MVNLDFNENEELNLQDEENPVKDEKEKNRVAVFMIVCVALLLLLLSVGGWIVYDKIQTKSEWASLQVQFDSSRNILKEEYNRVLQKMDSLNSSNVDLQHELNSKKQQIDKLNADLEKIVSEKNSDLNEARAKIQELNARIKELLSEIENLKAQNRELMAGGGGAGAGGEGGGTGYKIVSGDSILVNTRPMKLSGGDASPITHGHSAAGRLQVAGINIYPVQGNGEEKSAALSKFTSSLKVVFELTKDSSLLSGNRELFLVLSAPNGNTISGAADGKAQPASGSFQTNDGVQKVYTVKLTPYYDKANGSKVEYTWKQNTRFNPGEYKAEVFFNGNKIGEGKQNLKRGTKPFPF